MLLYLFVVWLKLMSIRSIIVLMMKRYLCQILGYLGMLWCPEHPRPKPWMRALPRRASVF